MPAKIFISCIVMGVFSGTLLAQQEAAPMDMAARKESVVTLREHIEQREERLSELAKDIIALDQRVETRIDKILKTLGGLKDSNESKTKVTRTKEEAIEGLRKTIEAYDRKRAEIREKMRTSNSEGNREVLAADVKKLDDRISKRVEQIVELSKTFTQHTDMDKYESAGGGYYGVGGWYHEDVRINEDWKQNRRDTNRTNVVQKDLYEALKNSADYLKQRKSQAEAKLQQPLNDAQKEFYTSEKESASRLLSQREQQMIEISKPTGNADASPIGRDQAYQVDQVLEDARRDLAHDISDIMRKYTELVNERTRIQAMQDNLKDREDWLAKHANDAQPEEKK